MIDCEGMDIEIIRSFDFEEYYPSVICIEDSNLPFEGELDPYMKSKNYSFTASIGISKVYLSNEYMSKYIR